MNLIKYLLPILLVALFCNHSFAEPSSKFAMPLSLSAGLGSKKSNDLNLDSRTMNAFSIEALPSYQFGKWMIGPHIDYRIQGQISSLADANGSNLKGRGWLAGLGVRHNISDLFFVQGAIDFLGAYDLSRDTATSENVDLKSPLGLRFKSGYAFIKSMPNLTFDLDLQYLRFDKLNRNGSQTNDSFDQIIASVGVTFKFLTAYYVAPTAKKETVKKEEATPAQAPVKSETSAAKDEIALGANTEKVGDSLKVNLAGTNFNSGSAELSSAAKEQFKKTALLIVKAKSKVRIIGHTDSTGNAERNQQLSLGRAKSVKEFLVSHGANQDDIQIEGLGSSKPVADNATSEGRTKNRRVEIFID